LSETVLHGEIVPSGFFVVRTPLLPIEELECWSEGLSGGAAVERAEGDDAALGAALAADRERLRGRLRALCDRPEIREALFLASPSLFEGLELWRAQPESKKGQRAERALVRYFLRMTSRATPFGLFSGCSLGTVDGESGASTRLTLGPRSAYRRHTRLDMDFLFALCEDLGRDRALRRELTYRPNSSLYLAAGRWRFAEARMVNKSRSHHLVAVDRTEPLDATLHRAEGGARIADLAASLSTHSSGEITLDEAEEFVDELIDSQVLVPDLSPAVTGREALHDLIAQAEGLPGGFGKRLAEARDALASLDAGGPGAAPERYREISAGLARLPTTVELARLFQVDMIKPGASLPAPPAGGGARGEGTGEKSLVLGAEVLEEIARGLDVLRRTANRRPDLLEKFRQEFVERFGDAREVPLAEALDEESGIGFDKSEDAGAEASPLLQGLPLPGAAGDASVAWSQRESHLLALLTAAQASGARQIDLTPEDVERLTVANGNGQDGGPPPLADAFQVMVTLAAASQKALDAGDFQVLLAGAVGPSGARLLGRFCHADAELCAAVGAHLSAEEALSPESVFAEVVHLPQGRIGNILSRPVLRRYEIPFLGRSGARPEDQIPLGDLTVTVTGRRVVLRSRRLDRVVIPRLTSAHNYRRGSLGLYRFLCVLQGQGIQGGASWSWGPLDNAPFLPRVTAGRSVLARASWWLAGPELRHFLREKGPARFAAVRAWRMRRGLPRMAFLAEGDNELLVDFDNVLAVETFLDVVAGRDRARLVEMFPAPEQLCARGPEGRFVHELVVPFVMAPGRPTDQQAAPRPAPSAVRRSFPPGSEWLYAKLYTGTATADRLLGEVAAPLAREAIASGAADSWFFLRYGDPAWHLRLRFHGAPEALHSRLLPALQAAVAPLLDDGRAWRLQLDTYEREVERYGGPESIALAEDLFHADSDAVVELLDLLEGDAGADARWRLALAGVDRLLSDLGLDAAAKLAVVERLRRVFWREIKGDKPLRIQLDRKLRAERGALELLLAGDPAAPLAPALVPFDRRAGRLGPIAAELARLEADGRLTTTVADMAASFAHMHVNRLIRSSARTHEMVLYDFLHHIYASREARNGRRDRSVAEAGSTETPSSAREPV
jgi:class I lanthipeptide synthase